jgi:hypothetical protein
MWRMLDATNTSTADKTMGSQSDVTGTTGPP